MPWPMATTFRESMGNERRSTLTTAVDALSAASSVRVRFQCVNQRRSGTPSGRASGAASTA